MWDGVWCVASARRVMVREERGEVEEGGGGGGGSAECMVTRV